MRLTAASRITARNAPKARSASSPRIAAGIAVCESSGTSVQPIFSAHRWLGIWSPWGAVATSGHASTSCASAPGSASAVRVASRAHSCAVQAKMHAARAVRLKLVHDLQHLHRAARRFRLQRCRAHHDHCAGRARPLCIEPARFRIACLADSTSERLARDREIQGVDITQIVRSDLVCSRPAQCAAAAPWPRANSTLRMAGAGGTTPPSGEVPTELEGFLGVARHRLRECLRGRPGRHPCQRAARSA